MRIFRCFAAVLAAALLAAAAPAQEPVHRDALYQFSALSALKAGVYDAMVTCGDMRQRGDFGIGTFEKLNGEMILLHGVVYRAGSDGTIRTMENLVGVPFATVAFFSADQTFSLDAPTDLAEANRLIAERLPTPNIPYAVRIEGTFDYVKARSVPAQKKPYFPLEQVIKNQQVVFEYTNVAGTAVGFYTPAYLDGLQSPGFHLHFLKKDRKGGGHLLDARMRQVKVSLDAKREVRMILPTMGPFDTTDFSAPAPKYP